MAKTDSNQKASKLVTAITKGKAVKGESLLGSLELKRQLREAKTKEKRKER